jgi:hypothetical protein
MKKFKTLAVAFIVADAILSNIIYANVAFGSKRIDETIDCPYGKECY